MLAQVCERKHTPLCTQCSKEVVGLNPWVANYYEGSLHDLPVFSTIVQKYIKNL